MLWKCCTQYASKFGKLSSGHRTGKCQFSFQSQRRGNTKECLNNRTIALISHTSKVMLKILQARFQQYVNRELPDVQAGFRKGRGTRDQIANICRIIEKAREFQKHIWSESEVKSLSCVRFFVTPWTVAYQASPFMGFSRQILEWVPIPFAMGSSRFRDQTQVSSIFG